MKNNKLFGNSIIVASPVGSLPMGGAKKTSPIYALEKASPQLMFDPKRITSQAKHDISLEAMLAFTIDNVLTDNEADQLIKLTEALGYRNDAPNIHTPPGMRMNKTVHWVDHGPLLAVIYKRIVKFLPTKIDGQKLSSVLSHRVNFYRYDNGDMFNQHVDGAWRGYGLNNKGTSMVEWDKMYSQLTMLLYLNGKEDGIQGGQTNLYKSDGSFVSVIPKKGKALFFRHGLHSKSVMHSGAPVHGKTPKYVARINILYDAL